MRAIVLLLAGLPLLAQNPVTDAAKASYNRIKQNLIETAEVMPEADYGYKLSPPQRAFGEWIEHTAQSAYTFCAGMQGTAPPDIVKSLPALKKKTELQNALRASFEYCDAAFQSMNDKMAAAEVTVGDRKLYPVTPMIGIVASLNEHYGNLVGYLRTKGIVPPSSARAMKKK